MYVFLIHSLKVFLKEQKMYRLLSVMFTNKEICKNIMNVLVLHWDRFCSTSIVRAREMFRVWCFHRVKDQDNDYI
jgi:hypothetical protein